MPEPYPPSHSATRWRDTPYIPDNYDDIPRLVKLARAARNERIVDFDWYFSADDIRRFQRAVYEWGSTVTGRYKCFDARVLAAIREALGETHSGLVLKEPKNSQPLDALVTCVPDGNGFRLRGHAPFDIIIGYAAGAFESQPWRVHLGESLAQALEQVAADLGWDFQRLQEERLRPVRNALFGFAVGYGTPTEAVSKPTGPPEEVRMHFRGPYSAFANEDCPCLFTEPVAGDVGVYLWTFREDAQYRVWYVGQTARGFGQRTGEHIAGYLSGQYDTYELEFLRKGLLRSLSPAQTDARWPESLPAFLERANSILPKILDFVRAVRFHVATLPNDNHLLNRAEGAIGRYFKKHPDDRCRNFFLPGIKLPQLIPYDREFKFLLTAEAPISGLPDEILE